MPSEARRIDGAVTIVTGGTGGIGAAIVNECAAAGGRVAVLDLDETLVKTVTSDAGGDCRGYAVDVSDPVAVRDLVAQVHADFGRIDVLVNNAGVAPAVHFLDLSIDDWRRTFAVNVDGPFLLTQAVGRLMVDQDPHPRLQTRGKIVNISSVASQNGRPLLASYGATKAALNHLSKTSSAVLAPHRIATTVVYPGNVMEGMWKDVGPALAAAEGRTAENMAASRAASTPLGRFQRPEETAAIVLYAIAMPGMALDAKIVWAEPHASPL